MTGIAVVPRPLWPGAGSSWISFPPGDRHLSDLFHPQFQMLKAPWPPRTLHSRRPTICRQASSYHNLSQEPRPAPLMAGRSRTGSGTVERSLIGAFECRETVHLCRRRGGCVSSASKSRMQAAAAAGRHRGQRWFIAVWHSLRDTSVSPLFVSEVRCRVISLAPHLRWLTYLQRVLWNILGLSLYSPGASRVFMFRLFCHI